MWIRCTRLAMHCHSSIHSPDRDYWQRCGLDRWQGERRRKINRSISIYANAVQVCVSRFKSLESYVRRWKADGRKGLHHSRPAGCCSRLRDPVRYTRLSIKKPVSTRRSILTGRLTTDQRSRSLPSFQEDHRAVGESFLRERDAMKPFNKGFTTGHPHPTTGWRLCIDLRYLMKYWEYK